jgi:hypothetical protein
VGAMKCPNCYRSQDGLEKVFPKEVYSAHGVLMGVQPRARSGLYVRRKRNEMAPTKMAL